MTEDSKPTPAEALRQALARKQAAAAGTPDAAAGRKRTERDAAARSFSKSKPQMRK